MKEIVKRDRMRVRERDKGERKKEDKLGEKALGESFHFFH